MNRKEIEAILIEKTDSDPAFRQQLVAAPLAAIEAVIGQAMPAGTTITIFEETPTSLCLVLPPSPQIELSDADLAGVSGGAVYNKEPAPNTDRPRKLSELGPMKRE